MWDFLRPLNCLLTCLRLSAHSPAAPVSCLGPSCMVVSRTCMAGRGAFPNTIVSLKMSQHLVNHPRDPDSDFRSFLTKRSRCDLRPGDSTTGAPNKGGMGVLGLANVTVKPCIKTAPSSLTPSPQPDLER
ncbi:hypothetical protein OH76DRAFT_697511 [Lentinus brumalis]|uniref:Uncharacterized protein n=1 Tax=Lentinus brumalis TaxID=2498619 RepID=A0A371D6A8_9APHY|nr:hypothetical protein OH76DRAFT_697511 [Polyporus brumalis]